jgi:hypothetical protein
MKQMEVEGARRSEMEMKRGGPEKKLGGKYLGAMRLRPTKPGAFAQG